MTRAISGSTPQLTQTVTPDAPVTDPVETTDETTADAKPTVDFRPPGEAKGWDSNGVPPGLLKKMGEQSRVGFELGFVKNGNARSVAPAQVVDAYRTEPAEGVEDATGEHTITV